jgi:hypothetical protein
MSLRSLWYTFLAAVALAAALFTSVWFSKHWNDPDLQSVVVDFAVACLPVGLSILIAFVPDLRRAHMAWRIGIITIGLIWSVLLARQQHLSRQTAVATQKQAVMSAVSESNLHSDQQIAAVRKDLQDVTKQISGTLRSLSSQVSKTESDLSGSISKVGVPQPKYAQLQFSFWNNSKLPMLIQELRPDNDGSFSADFTVTNISDTAATSAEIWVQVCDQCVFAAEPNGFDKPTGTPENARHKMFAALNPGVSLEKMTVKVKPSQPFIQFSDISLGLRYSCATCGKIGDQQILRINVTR